MSRCVFRPLPAVPGAVRHPALPPGDLAGPVHQPGRGQRLEDRLPLIRRYRVAVLIFFLHVGCDKKIRIIESESNPEKPEHTPCLLTTKEKQD